MDFTNLLRARPIVAENLRKDFGAFCRAAWPHVHRGTKLSWTWAHDLICEHLVAVWQGKTKRLVINCPPRFAKSTIVTILFPIWCWLHNPTLAFLCASYEIDLSTNHNSDRRRLMESEWFKSLFADRFQLATDRAQASEFSNSAGGQMLAASVNSKAMGRGGDFIILDDPLSADQAYSDAQRGEVIDWLTHMMPQRLNNPSDSRIIVVMQRLHQSDPTGFLLEHEPGEWTHLKLTLIAEETERIIFPVSGRVLVRKKGECLDPKRFPPRVVRDRQKNRLVWAGQFQQEPSPIEGNLIRVADVRYFGGKDPVTGARDPDLPTYFDQKIISVDCAFKDKASSDKVAILAIGVKGPRRFVLSAVNRHLDLDATEQAILSQHALFGPIGATLIEDAANGSAVVSHLKEKIAGVIPRSAQGGKTARMIASSPSWQSNCWFLDRSGAETNELINQITVFPNARNDDLADAMSQAEIWLQENAHRYGFIEFLKNKGAEWLTRAPSRPVPLAVYPGSAFCPKCGSADVEQYGSQPGARIHCFRCGVFSYPSVLGTAPCGHAAQLQIVLGGVGIRCAQCGAIQRPAPQPRKWSRRDLPRPTDWRN
jgi:predicted phage terminase large subunit-like protein